MSLGNPVVKNLQRQDFEASFGELVHCFQMGIQQKNRKGEVFKLNLTIELTMLGLWSLISQLPSSLSSPLMLPFSRPGNVSVYLPLE
ncbi:hypothetical protein ACFX13_041249 [Malus domestica]